MSPHTAPPFILPNERVVLFDGVCVLCNGWVKFLIRHDTAQCLRLAAVQSVEGQALLNWAGLPTGQFDSLVLIENGQPLLRSDAVLRIFALLPGPWRYLAWLRVMPRRLRDACYAHVAQNRYAWFGRNDACLLPHADHQRRFLHG